ncbi:NAD(P)(+) transhydrogenase (Re/Si-specific) subunit beta [candidate division KSB1 bacterium]|nr:NAD(P)(+) transhydrogenase (Re/Si-specific) subunit beta [candidate division KSB1 bacterium]
MTGIDIIIKIVYLIAAILFILGLKKLSSPKTARQGNQLAMLGMFLAVVMTAFKIINPVWVLVGLVIGAAVGAISAKKVQMTAMPQMVAIFNGFGGGASTLVAFSEYTSITGEAKIDFYITVVLSILIGTVTFFGSLIAYLKLDGTMKGVPITYAGQQFINALLLILIGVLGTLFVLDTVGIVVIAGMPAWVYLIAIVVLSTVLGITSVIPIGGADMPVVVSLLNSYSGLAAAATGFVLSNYVLIISGALVGASGLILTNIMCVAMNRSLANVLFAAVGSEEGAVSGEKEQRTVVRYTADDAAFMLEKASSVIIIPGYGLAVAQAQHILQEMATILQNQGIKVRYAIHPVAGRMPGHMNVLLAEANVPYDYLLEMDEINDDFQNTDVAFIVGANDVVNPAARYKKDSPLYGMPILNADQARTIMIIKRSLGAGFAGEANELFFDEKTMMVFGDAKKMITDIVHVLKG